MKLYELTSAYEQLLEQAEEMDPEVFQDTLESIEDAIEEKAQNIAKLIRNLEGDIEVLKQEEQRLKRRRTSLESKVKSIKDYLKNELEGAGIDKVKSAHFNISIRNNPPKVLVEDEKLIPSDYMIPKYSPDKKVLKELLQSGKEIPGVRLIQERGVQIR